MSGKQNEKPKTYLQITPKKAKRQANLPEDNLRDSPQQLSHELSSSNSQKRKELLRSSSKKMKRGSTVFENIYQTPEKQRIDLAHHSSHSKRESNSDQHPKEKEELIKQSSKDKVKEPNIEKQQVHKKVPNNSVSEIPSSSSELPFFFKDSNEEILDLSQMIRFEPTDKNGRTIRYDQREKHCISIFRCYGCGKQFKISSAVGGHLSKCEFKEQHQQTIMELDSLKRQRIKSNKGNSEQPEQQMIEESNPNQSASKASKGSKKSKKETESRLKRRSKKQDKKSKSPKKQQTPVKVGTNEEDAEQTDKKEKESKKRKFIKKQAKVEQPHASNE